MPTHLRPVVAARQRGEPGGERPRLALGAREVHPGVVGQVRLGHGEPDPLGRRPLQQQRQAEQPGPARSPRRAASRNTSRRASCSCQRQRVRRRVAGEGESGELVGQDEFVERLLLRDQVAEGDAVVEGAEGEVEPSDAAGPLPPARRSARCDGPAPRTPCRRGSHRSRRDSAGALADDLQPFAQRPGPGELQPERARRRPGCRGTPRRRRGGPRSPSRNVTPQAAVGRLEPGRTRRCLRECRRTGYQRGGEQRHETLDHGGIPGFDPRIPVHPLPGEPRCARRPSLCLQRDLCCLAALQIPAPDGAWCLCSCRHAGEGGRRLGPRPGTEGTGPEGGRCWGIGRRPASRVVISFRKTRVGRR